MITNNSTIGAGRIKYLILFVFTSLLCSQLHGQTTTEGKDFWLSFGLNYYEIPADLTFQIRIVTTKAANVTFTFTEIGTSVTIPIAANSVYTYDLSYNEREASYSEVTGISKKSIHIQSNENVSVYAINLSEATTDATIILPIGALNKSYFHLSYTPVGTYNDGYTIVATENNTEIYENNVLVAKLNKGDVYSLYLNMDMTGMHITTNKPVAYFTTFQCALVPVNTSYCDCMYAQLFPEAMWGREFLIPVTIRGKEIVRILASRDGTVITHIGGTVLSGSLTLNAGQYVELEISKSQGGCYIESDKPVAVASYLTGIKYSGLSYSLGDPAMAWVAPVEQMVKEVTVSPFFAAGSSILTEHHALIVVPTSAKNQTQIKIGAGSLTSLSGGSWTDHSSGYSFYSMPMTSNAGYTYKNPEGLIVYGYGLGKDESYYYLSGSSILNLEASFYVGDIYYQSLESEKICSGNFAIKAVIGYKMNSAPGHLRWFIDNVEETAFTDLLNWTKYFDAGTHNIKVIVKNEYGDEETLSTSIKVFEIKAGTISSNQTICYNTLPAQLNGTSATGGIEPYKYQWQSSSDKINWTNLAGATELNYSSGNLSQTTYFRRTDTDSCKTVYSDTVTITVRPQLTAGTITSNQTICYDTAPAKLDGTPTTGGAGIYSYQWQSSTDTKTWSDITGATEQNYASGNLKETRYFRRQTADSECGTVYSDTVLITVRPQLIAGAIPSEYNQTICYNTIPSKFDVTPTTGGGGIYLYQWQISTDTKIWSDITGLTEQNYASSNLKETRYFRRQTADSECGTIYSDTITITVKPELLQGTITSNQIVCYETVPVKLTGTTPAVGIISQWQMSADSIKWSEIPDAKEQNYSPDTLRETVYFRRADIDSQCGTVYSDTVKLTVVPKIYLMPETETLPPYQRNTEYQQTFSTNAASPTFSYSGNLPTGLFFDASGNLHGTVSNREISTPTITIIVEDPHGCKASRDYTLSGNIFIPKIFSPNGDGINDVFMPGFQIYIADRLGVEVYKGDNGWDGTHKGKIVPPDIYFYVLTYSVNNKETKITGYIGIEK